MDSLNLNDNCKSRFTDSLRFLQFLSAVIVYFFNITTRMYLLKIYNFVIKLDYSYKAKFNLINTLYVIIFVILSKFYYNISDCNYCMVLHINRYLIMITFILNADQNTRNILTNVCYELITN